MKSLRKSVLALAAVALFTAQSAMAAPARTDEPFDRARLSESVRKKLVTIPSFDVFDNLAYKIEGGTVTLYGDVQEPWTKREAEKRVAKIGGVDAVVNNIRVLPLSTFDDRIRVHAYRSIFGTGSLYRYAMGTNPSIRIIVDRGHIRLEGVVGTRGDARLAYIAAHQVPGVFSVTNNLRVEREG